jgi:hypothetical protein
MELPRALAPWSPYLAVFPRDLALSLGPVLQRLSSAVGPLQVRRLDGGGEVDGYDGIDRHGSYDRLLATEWLLADEMPDEFLRRAVMGEHLFLHASRPEPGGTRTSVAIFDAGPGQLGSPRIAQLAVLIVLAQRAEAAGARFAWGVLQDPDAPLHPEVTESGILRLLQSRTPHEASDAQIGAWHARVRGWKEMDDLWIVGPPRLVSLPAARGASVLQVWDVLDPEMRRVAVRVRPGGAGVPAREMSLDLPDDSVCARLLRDPFAATVARPRRLEPRLRPVSNLVFSATGAKLFARAAGGGITSFPLPNSPRADVGPPRWYDPAPRELPVAVGTSRKRILVAVERDGALIVHDLQRTGGGLVSVRYEPPSGEPRFFAGLHETPPPLQALFPVGRRLWARGEWDTYKFLFQLIDPPAFTAPGELRCRTVASAAAVLAGVLYVVEPALARRPARLVRYVGDREPETVAPIEGPGQRAFFGFGGPPSLPERMLTAVEHDEERAWQIFGPFGSCFLTPFSGTQVVGVGQDPQQPGSPGLLLLDEDWRTLVLAGRNWSRKVATAASEIEHVTVHHASSLFAYATAAGEITVGSFDHDGPLFRLLPEDAQ